MAHPDVRVLHGDSLDVLAQLPDASVHGVVTDPPYGLAQIGARKVRQALARWLAGEMDFVPDGRGFMSRHWDRFVPPPALWQECLRVLTPGGHVLSFAGSRTQDLMGMSLRLAGFEVRDAIGWAYGAGMPKVTTVGRQIDKRAGHDQASNTDDARTWAGWAPGLKPALEPILVARKPLDGTVVDTTLAYGTGAMNIDDCRVPFRGEADEAESKGKNQHRDYGTLSNDTVNAYGDFSMLGVRRNYDALGRWPANLMLDADQAAALDAQSGSSTSRQGKPRASTRAGEGWRSTHTGAEYDDHGGASRFFHVFDAEANLDGLGSRVLWCPKAPSKERPVVDGMRHPTVKPLSLMRTLVRLVTPPAGTVLDPFAGSGTTIEAALLEGLDVIGIEREPDYLPLIEQRIARSSAPSAAAA